jgi:hypothetical protein
MQTTVRDSLSRKGQMYELSWSSEIVIETPNKSNQSILEPTIFVTCTALHVTVWCQKVVTTLNSWRYERRLFLHITVLKELCRAVWFLNAEVSVNDYERQRHTINADYISYGVSGLETNYAYTLFGCTIQLQASSRISVAIVINNPLWVISLEVV